MNKRYFGLEDLANSISKINDIATKFRDFAKGKECQEIKDLFDGVYGIDKNGKDKGKAISLITKYAYFVTKFEFPIYDSIVKEMYPKICNYCKFDKAKASELEDINGFLKAINELKKSLSKDSNNINYDTLDMFLWYLGKIFRGNYSLIIDKENYKSLTTLDKMDLDKANFNNILNKLKDKTNKNIKLLCEFIEFAQDLNKQ